MVTAKPKNIFRVLLSGRMLAAALMGFSSGLPLILTGSTMQAWMKEGGIDLSLIGFMSLVGLPYTMKFLWAPFFDRFAVPGFGRRRGWLLVVQILLAAAIAAMAFVDPGARTSLFVVAAFMVTFFSASQDILIDSYRRETLADEELGLGSSLYVNGYRVAMLLASSGALILAEQTSWRTAYLIMAAAMGVGILCTLFSREPEMKTAAPRNIREAVVEPILEFFRRGDALLTLAFIFLYKVGEQMASSMTMPMYLDLGFTKTEVGSVVKLFGFWASLGGGFLGGLWMIKLGIKRALIVFGVLQSVGLLGFALLPQWGHSLEGLAGVVFTENLCAGMATTAYVAFMASQTNRRFTATQYALLSSLMGVPRVIVSAPTGWMAQQMGWPMFFVVCTVLTVPGLWLITRLKDEGAMQVPQPKGL